MNDRTNDRMTDKMTDRQTDRQTEGDRHRRGRGESAFSVDVKALPELVRNHST